MLADHGDLKLVIEGHTDATGDDAHNQELTASCRLCCRVSHRQRHQRRSCPGVGQGRDCAIGDNATVLGRQQNRRVVIRKQ